ncbi:MAG TPA: hypothetical protein VHI13_08865 [Candidatus Kapabacteria bacterium]|nr:hypothetical protein [Candidatus Kapabacteria bacterium]
MNTPVLNILTQAYYKSGIVAPGESISNQLAQNALNDLNMMFDSWNVDRLLIFATPPEVFNLVGGVSTVSGTYYTIGPGGAFNTTRPVQIERANILLNAGGSITRIPLQILNMDQWQALRVPATPSSFPTSIWYDETYSTAAPIGLGRIYTYPVANMPVQIELFTWSALPNFPNIQSSVILPPGYWDALVYNLAIRVAIGILEPDPGVVALAQSSLARLEAANSPEPRIVSDPAASPRNKRSSWSYLTGY